MGCVESREDAGSSRGKRGGKRKKKKAKAQGNGKPPSGAKRGRGAQPHDDTAAAGDDHNPLSSVPAPAEFSKLDSTPEDTPRGSDAAFAARGRAANKTGDFTSPLGPNGEKRGPDESTTLSSITDEERGSGRGSKRTSVVASITQQGSESSRGTGKQNRTGSVRARPKVTIQDGPPSGQAQGNSSALTRTNSRSSANTAMSNASTPRDGAKWRRHADARLNAMSRTRAASVKSMSGQKLARLQKWIDFSDQGTSPLGPLLNPQRGQEQNERDRQLREYIEQGVPMFGQLSSVDELTGFDKRRSSAMKAGPGHAAAGAAGAPGGAAGLTSAGAKKFKSRVTSALEKAKRRQSMSWRLAPPPPKDTGEEDRNREMAELARLPSGQSDLPLGTPPNPQIQAPQLLVERPDGASSSSESETTATNAITASMVNLGHDAEISQRGAEDFASVL